MKKYRSVRLSQKKKKQFQIKFILVFVILIVFIFFLSFLSKNNFLRIKQIKITGNNIIEKNELKEIIDINLSNNYYHLFSKRNILIYPKQSIQKDILKKFPRIKDTNLNLDLPNLLNINITERVPYVLWCKDTATSSCFFADENGYIFSRRDGVVEENFFKYCTNLEVKLSDAQIITNNIFDSNSFNEIDSFVNFVKGLNLDPYKFVEVGNKYEIYFAKNSKIIFDKNQNIKETINNLQSVLNMEEFTDIEEVKKLEYIDLRFGNKVFYK